MGRPERLRVLVADDHPLYREALARTVRSRPEFELVGEAEDGRRALALIHELRPDVALVDLHMPGLDGMTILRAARRDELATRVVMISGDLSSQVVYEAVAAGAAGYLPKDATSARIADAVAAVGRGSTVLPPEVQAGLADQIRRHQDTDRTGLSAREREVLGLTADGLSAPEIAARLHLSPATVRSHLQSLYAKLGVGDRAAAVAEAMRRGLLD